jgi:DUF35 OB-fold domain, acyl-CoA-associated
MDLPQVPVVRSRLAQGVGQGPHLQLGAAVASGPSGPYIVVLVELPDAGNVRMLGNLLGDPKQDVPIGAEVQAVFEPHDDAKPPFTLVQWKLA